MRKLLPATLAFAFVSFFYLPAKAQSWRWGIRGGSTYLASNGPDETVIDMATDPNGNVYVLSSVYQYNLSVGNTPVTSYGSEDILLTSFRCDGTLRWTKNFGTASEDIPGALKTDSLGGVYIAGAFAKYYETVHLDMDSTWATGPSYKTMFLAKYDTAGNYKWLRMPEADTVGIFASIYNGTVDMDVDGAGNIYWMICSEGGQIANGNYVAPGNGLYVLKYSNAGAFLNGTKLQITANIYGPRTFYMKRDFRLKRYYITGSLLYTSGITFGGIPETLPASVGAFDDSGNLIWQRHNTNGFGGGFSKPVTDNGYVYLAGNLASDDTFNTYVAHNTLSPYYGSPFVVKLDSNGNNVWAISAMNGLSASALTTADLTGDRITVAGAYDGVVKWPGWNDSLYLYDYYDVFITQLDAATGAFIRADTLRSGHGTAEFPRRCTSDRHGNFYVGGDFPSVLYVNNAMLTTAGGGSDFFVAKYGYDNCNCTSIPAANFTVAHTGAAHFHFTYTGTTTGVDSVVWNFGDGHRATGDTLSHTFTATGVYNVCVTAYSVCGNNTHCDTLNVPTGITNLGGAFGGIEVYPNPVSNTLFISGAAAMQINIYSIVGQQVYKSVASGSSAVVGTSGLPAGTYILELRDTEGNRAVTKIIKE
ncbi:T9SS type A sorting domain-containing protein [Chitinophagaceae bacterium MMS25-I14]